MAQIATNPVPERQAWKRSEHKDNSQRREEATHIQLLAQPSGEAKVARCEPDNYSVPLK